MVINFYRRYINDIKFLDFIIENKLKVKVKLDDMPEYDYLDHSELKSRLINTPGISRLYIMPEDEIIIRLKYDVIYDGSDMHGNYSYQLVSTDEDYMGII